MITLIYGTYSGTTLTTNLMTYNELEYYEVPFTERDAGTTLRQIDYSHTIASKYIYHITISADELYQSTKLSFIKNFYSGDAWWLNNTRVVLQESGEAPFENLESDKNLPEIKLSLKARL